MDVTCIQAEVEYIFIGCVLGSYVNVCTHLTILTYQYMSAKENANTCTNMRVYNEIEEQSLRGSLVSSYGDDFLNNLI